LAINISISILNITTNNIPQMKKTLQNLLFILFSCLSIVSNAQVSGIVYKDYNASGSRDNTAGTLVEPLVAGITVKAYSATDALLATTTTNSSGAYSFTSLTLPLRIEFSGFPASYLPGAATDIAGIVGSSVQFITSATTTADFRINNPDNYSQANPMVVRGQNYIGPASNNSGDGTLNGTYYNVGQILDPVINGNTIKEFDNLDNPTLGTTYGLAYSRRSKKLFASAVVRNYFGNKTDATNGDSGFDDIYSLTFADANPVFPPTASTATLTQGATIDLSSLGVTMGADPRFNFTITGSAQYVDSNNLYRKVGKIGIGDIDISTDGDTLFVVNMNAAAPTLVILNVSTATASLIGNIAMPNPGCTNGTFRPWAVKYFEGKVYIGGVCDASTGTAANLQAYVYRYDGGSTFTQVATLPLNYTRGKATFRTDGTNQNANWRPWTDTWGPAQLPLGPDLVAQPQPMLMDIEFTEDGSMILAFGDRFTYQTAHNQRQYAVTTGTTYFSTVSAGDIKKFCNIAGVLTLETAAGGCLQSNTDNGSVTTSNPIGGAGGLKEFFDDDYYNTGTSSTGQAGHSETALGALAVLPGRNQLLATSFDPISTIAPGSTSGEVNTSGVRFFNSDNGNQVQVTTAAASHKGWIDFDATFVGSNRKGGNMGDIEILADAAPIEIGNRIWNDANANGIQDPGEAVFANVSVELFLDANNDGIPDGAALATVTTDANGQYIFSNQVTGEYTAGDPGFGHAKFNITQLVSKQNYIVRIGASDWNNATGQGAGDLAGYHLTTANVVGNGIADLSDNDATISTEGANNYAQIRLTTGILGENNHTYDFGFKNKISLCGNVWNDLNGNAATVGSPDGSEQVINGTNTGAGVTTGAVLYANLINASGNVEATAPIAADGSYCFPLVPANTTGLTVQLTTNQGVAGQPKPTTSLPTGWVNTGENKNSQAGTADPGANSEIPVTTLITNITLQNFGIQQVPESAVNLQSTVGNPGADNNVTVPSGAFQTSNVGMNPNTQDYNGGTVTNIRLTSFPSNATSITVNGTTYLSTNAIWPANGGAGITIPYTNGTGPTQTITVDPVDGNVDVVIPFASIDNAGKEDPTPGSVTLPFRVISLCGVVWNDVNGNAATVGSPDGAEAVINGTNAGAGITTGAVLYANLLDPNNKVIATTPIAADGTYCFANVPQSTTGLTVQLTTNQGTVGGTKPATNIPAGWVTTGENKNSQGGSTDPTADSEIPVTTAAANITVQNFGIQQVPESAVHTETIGLNPGGTVCTNVNPLWFETSNVGTNPNTQDYNGGTVTSIRFTAFPTNATSITINSITYLSTDAAWPANGGAGVTILYTAGVGPLAPVCLDPIDGNVTSVIPFAAKDNAGKEDPTPGSVTLVYNAVLPVRFISINGTKQNKSIVVGWEVGTEVNVSNYELQRSADGNNFETIGTVTANNSSTYQFEDKNPINGVNYYRVKSVDINGFIQNSSTVKVAAGVKVSLQIVPNPVVDFVNISGLSGKGTISIFTIEGKKVIDFIVKGNTVAYNLQQLKTGIYIIQYLDNGDAQTLKMIKK
jgi:hypothetical protein